MKKQEYIELKGREKTPKTKIYTEIYTSSGGFEDRDVLMLLPGGPGNDHTVCDYGGHSFAEALFPFVDVLLIDPRGCGKSEKSPIESCTLDHYIDDVEAIREHYKIKSNKFILFGVSYGGTAALGYAIKYSDRLKKLILVCGGVSGEFIEIAKDNLAKIGTPEQIEMGESILNGTLGSSKDVVEKYYKTLGPLYSRTFDPKLPTPSISYNLELANWGFKTFLKEFDYRPNLSKVRCPTLIIAGEYDWIADPRQAEVVHKGIASSKLLVYQDCAHMIWIDQWERFLKDIQAFLKEPSS